jgi:hypothetical protein
VSWTMQGSLLSKTSARVYICGRSSNRRIWGYPDSQLEGSVIVLGLCTVYHRTRTGGYCGWTQLGFNMVSGGGWWRWSD